jgi:hypothetical protein
VLIFFQGAVKVLRQIGLADEACNEFKYKINLSMNEFCTIHQSNDWLRDAANLSICWYCSGVKSL